MWVKKRHYECGLRWGHKFELRGHDHANRYGLRYVLFVNSTPGVFLSAKI